MLEINDGMSFFKLIKYLKGKETSILTFTKNKIYYDEIISVPVEGSNKKISTNSYNSCELDVGLIGSYIYNFDTDNYILCFDTKIFLAKIKAKSKEKIFIYKKRDDETIYINVITQNQTDVSGISAMNPLNMKSYETYDNGSGDETYPNCTADLDEFKKKCEKIRPTSFKEITLICHDSYMECSATSAVDAGEHFIFGKKPILEASTIDINSIKINMDHIMKISKSASDSPKISIASRRTKIDMVITLPAKIFKNLAGLSGLSKDDNIKFFFIDNEYIKLVARVGKYGIVRTFLKN
jgi:hypothetical protein